MVHGPSSLSEIRASDDQSEHAHWNMPQKLYGAVNFLSQLDASAGT
jgi:hypothetical protein